MSKEENKRIARMVVEAYNSNNLALFDNCFDPNVVWKNLPYREEPERRGIKAVKSLFQEGLIAFPDLKYSIQEIVAEKDKVWLYGPFEGTHKGYFIGIPPTGNRVKYDMAFLFHFKNNKIVKASVILDSLTIFIQLGRAILKENKEEQIREYLLSLQVLGLLRKNIKI
ncbi:MAG: ester cyclase [Promethearchaeota archaeon]